MGQFAVPRKHPAFADKPTRAHGPQEVHRQAVSGLELVGSQRGEQRWPDGPTADIATTHDHLTGGGFDLPPIEPIFNSYIARFGLADRLTFTPGDFLADPLPSADVLVMGHVLHDWDLDQKRVLVQKAYAALPKGGALIVYDAIIDDRRENAFGLLMSLNMLIEDVGFDYTGADCRGWMSEAGFRESYVQHLVGPDSMVVGNK